MSNQYPDGDIKDKKLLENILSMVLEYIVPIFSPKGRGTINRCCKG